MAEKRKNHPIGERQNEKSIFLASSVIEHSRSRFSGRSMAKMGNYSLLVARQSALPVINKLSQIHSIHPGRAHLNDFAFLKTTKQVGELLLRSLRL